MVWISNCLVRKLPLFFLEGFFPVKKVPFHKEIQQRKKRTSYRWQKLVFEIDRPTSAWKGFNISHAQKFASYSALFDWRYLWGGPFCLENSGMHVPIPQMWPATPVGFMLGWPKSYFGFFHKMPLVAFSCLWLHLKELC